MAHITGGGLSNLLRLHQEHGYIIDQPIPVPPEFAWMQSVGNITPWEMYRTFNMGLGIVLIVSSSVAGPVTKWLAERLPGTQVVGSVVSGGRKATHAEFDSVTYTDY
mmetsp:Transcript_20029/g.32858  ORF Transcript_20029/g.32858 Transcript_20029/m.32858 type:complete len:107 (+) Transcript_20029:531-851(+)